jgi:hypothetical protein
MKGTAPRGVVVDFAEYRRRTKPQVKQRSQLAKDRQREELIDEVAYYLLLAAKAIQAYS